jgi:hypothetical protein
LIKPMFRSFLSNNFWTYRVNFPYKFINKIIINFYYIFYRSSSIVGQFWPQVPRRFSPWGGCAWIQGQWNWCNLEMFFFSIYLVKMNHFLRSVCWETKWASIVCMRMPVGFLFIIYFISVEISNFNSIKKQKI